MMKTKRAVRRFTRMNYDEVTYPIWPCIHQSKESKLTLPPPFSHISLAVVRTLSRERAKQQEDGDDKILWATSAKSNSFQQSNTPGRQTRLVSEGVSQSYETVSNLPLSRQGKAKQRSRRDPKIEFNALARRTNSARPSLLSVLPQQRHFPQEKNPGSSVRQRG
jgi:hypothetical protein